MKVGWYVIGLVLGLATVGAWLYFASAYTNRSYHRDKTYRRLAVGVFLLLIAVKVTNPLHHEYFTTTALTEPFPHLSLAMGPLHWTAMGLSYALAFVGYFMLLDLFKEIDMDTRPLLVLLGVTALPVAFDIAGFTMPMLIDITYEPLGVAVFSVGIAFVYLEQFENVRLASEDDRPIIVLDSEGRIKQTNHAARKLFSVLDTAVNEPIETVLPRVADYLDHADPVIDLQWEDDIRYYRLTETPYSTKTAGLGSTITLTDVTERERYRQELERQNERLDRFASLVSHDLRNPLTVAQGQLELLGESITEQNDHTERVQSALDRMETMIDDILTMARQGQPVEEGEPVQLTPLVEASWRMVDTNSADLEISDDLTIMADHKRLRLLFENLFRNAIDHSQMDVTVRIGPLENAEGFFVEDTGPGIPPSEREQVFEAGYTTDQAGTGFGLAIVRDIVAAHDWDITVTDSAEGGARFEISGVETIEDAE